MKKSILSIGFFTGILCLIILVMPLSTKAKMINFSVDITDNNGCNWHIEGWVDVSILRLSIDAYDFCATSCTGEKHCNAQIEWNKKVSKTKAPLSSLTFIDSLNGWAVGVNGTVIQTGDGGEIWKKQNLKTNTHLFSVCFLTDRVGWTVGWGGRILHTNNGGNNRSVQANEIERYYTPMIGVETGLPKTARRMKASIQLILLILLKVGQ